MRTMPLDIVVRIIEMKILGIEKENSHRGKVNQTAQFAVQMLEDVLRDVHMELTK